MAGNEMDLEVQLVYAHPHKCHSYNLKVSRGETVRAVIESSGILKDCPEIDLSSNKVGVFSKLRELDDEVKNGDRIEIYRPLLLDPKQARRLRAEKQNNSQ